MAEAVQLNIRPMTTPWKLALRIGLVSLVTCFVGNAVFWSSVYIDAQGSGCGYFCPVTPRQLLTLIGEWGAFTSISVVPVTTIILTPLILVAHRSMLSVIPETTAFALAVALAVAVFLGIGAVLIVAAGGAQISLEPVIDLAPVMITILAISALVTVSIFATGRALTKWKQ